MSDATTGALSGASAGAPFGPWGAVAGAVLGGIFGGSSGRKRRRAEELQLKKNTKQAYSISQGALGDISNSRDNINAQYSANLATELARYSASGRLLTDDARAAIVGRNAQERDSQLAETDTREDTFRNSTAYDFVKKDYDYLTNVRNPRSMEIPSQIITEGRSGESFFTAEQKDLIRGQTLDVNRRGTDVLLDDAYFQEYANAIFPTLDQYATGRFGTEEDRADYEQAVTDRITAANLVYDERAAEVRGRGPRQRGNR